MRCALLLLLCCPALALGDDVPSVRFLDGQKPADRRLTVVRTLNDKDFFLRAPGNLNAWKSRRQAVREQVLVATGLWPLPPKTPLAPVIHGRIDRAGYSVEKVYFASLPGHYVTGNLYRPRTADGQLRAGKLPAVLCPHGHWRNGRFYDAGETAARAQVASKAEKTLEGARYPLQARCAQLARLGCVVFHYDMVGYADSTTLSHSAFADVEAELRLQNLMGLQTWNSIRALDFVCGLPEVDGKRVGVTGASGGGTQTFILCAIDERPVVAFPAVMVSTQMQGGCVCENCSYLRIGTGNVEFAALFAPKPLAMSGANDWTIDIERKGLPELKAIYKLHDRADLVTAKCWPKYDHNYNQLAREMMYNWFNKYLHLGHASPVEEQPFKPIPPAQLSVFDETHPRPKDSAPAAKLLDYLTAVSNRQIEALKSADATEPVRFSKVLGPALRVMMGTELPRPRQVEAKEVANGAKEGKWKWRGYLIGRRRVEQVPALWLEPKGFAGTVVVWVDPAGKASLVDNGKLAAGAQTLLDRGVAILAPDAFGTGELALDSPPAVNARFAGYTFGYNRTLVSQRVHDILTAVALARKQDGVKRVHLLGRGKAGPWVLLARGLCGTGVDLTAADMNRFRFDSVRKMTDEMMLPGALKYGGLPALAALAAPGELLVHNHRGTGSGQWLKAVYKAAGAESKLQRSGDQMAEDKVIAWLLR
jgi:dienelactone hydrolase